MDLWGLFPRNVMEKVERETSKRAKMYFSEGK